MNRHRTDEFRLDLPDGLVIERLPVGLANGQWHLAFVCSGVDFLAGDPARAVHFAHEFRSRVMISAVDGTLDYQGGGSSGGEAEQEVRMRYARSGPTSLEITYLHDGAAVAREVIDLA